MLKDMLRERLHPKLLGLALKLIHITRPYRRSPYVILVYPAKLIFRPDPNNRMLNIGGGDWYVCRWENIDFQAHPACVDYNLDLRYTKRLPIADSCTQKIFTSHVLEHLDDTCVINLLKECHRILKVGGILRISVPDMEKALNAYFRKDNDFFQTGEIKLVGDSIERRLTNFFASYQQGKIFTGPIVEDELVRQKLAILSKHDFIEWCADFIPVGATFIGHVNGFDYGKLENLLKLAGFQKVYKSSFRNSGDVIMRGEKFDNRPISSLFVEAIR